MGHTKFIKEIMSDYKSKCFLDKGSSEDMLEAFLTKKVDYSSSLLHRADILDQNSQSEVSCEMGTCIIKNACVTKDAGLRLFGSSDHVSKEKNKLKSIVKQSILPCTNCHNGIYDHVERATSGWSYKLKDVATLGSG